MKDVISVHYGEIALKGSIRSWFEDRLAQNIEVALRDEFPVRVKRLYGRMIVETDVALDLWPKIIARLKDIFGLSWFGRAVRTKMEWPAIEDATRRLLDGMGHKRFGVRTKKADTDWPLGRTETSARLGAFVQDTFGWKVDLTNPDLWILVELVNGEVILTAERTPGLNGLPVGVSGKALALLSGGIDSPVAAWAMMSRGLRMDMIHFHSAPHTSLASQEKVLDLARALTRFQPTIYVGMVPFAPCQQVIVREAPSKYRVLLYRRMMMRIAETIAGRTKSEALVTGESLGQVASQTISNLGSVQSCVKLPILRPLIGMDKETIIGLGRRAGTFDISTRPHDDCCTFLMPKKPAVASTPEELDEAEKNLDIPTLVGEAIERIETRKLIYGRSGDQPSDE